MELTGPVRKELRLLLQGCYPNYDSLRILIQESLSESLEIITPLGPMPTVTFNLIEWAIARGRMTELVQAVAADNLTKVEVQRFAAKFQFAKSSAGEVERVVLEKVGFENVAQWIDKFSTLRRQICRIEPQPASKSLAGFGSGFLVAPDIVATNWHVREAFAVPEQVILRFDYENDTTEGKPWKLAPVNWELAGSSVENLDYALLRLAGRAADDVVTGGVRGFVRPSSLPMESKEPILILQHPAAQPLKLSIGTVEVGQTAKQRVTYTANTLGGSSGSPILNMALETIGIHHFGNSTANAGVLWSAIAEDLRAQGKLQLIG